MVVCLTLALAGCGDSSASEDGSKASESSSSTGDGGPTAGLETGSAETGGDASETGGTAGMSSESTGDGTPSSGLTIVSSRAVDVQGTTMTYYVADRVVDGEGPVDQLRWSYVIGGQPLNGDSRPILFVHGAPECWLTYAAQMAALAPDRPIVAVNLLGYGPDGDITLPAGAYNAQFMAEQIVGLMSDLDIDVFDLVSHDWGTAMASHIAGSHGDHVHRFVRTEAPVSTYDPSNTPWWDVMSDPVMGVAAVNALVAADDQTDFPPEDIIDEDDIDQYAAECAVPNRFEAWRRSFVDTPYEPMMVDMAALAAQTTLPVLLLQGDSDPGQPLEYFDDVEDIYPDVRLRVITNSDHFIQLEQPDQVTAHIRDFLLSEHVPAN